MGQPVGPIAMIASTAPLFVATGASKIAVHVFISRLYKIFLADANGAIARKTCDILISTFF
jgi:hypothetical protein